MLRFLFVALLLLSTACSKNDAGAKSALSYGEDARATYEQSLIRFRKGDCIAAEPGFRLVRREFPYSRFAALAELRLADCLFQQDKYSEAIQAYRQFLRVRPSHSEVPYARFRIAQSYYEQIPSGWFATPPAHERDQGAASDALIHLRRFVADFPDNARVPEAQEMMDKCIRLLAKHELYVARFYMQRKAYRGVISRLEGLLASYPGSGLAPEAMMLLAKAHRQNRDPDAAKAVYTELVSRFPDTEQAKKARSRLRK